jgi:catechol 2,3-dioxygenase-like lactoylglutathione lyase family enzyme
MVRIGSIVLNVKDPDRAATFWGHALGYTASPGNPHFLRDGTGGGPRLHLDDGDRTHLDLWVASAEEQDAEVERLVALGARRVEWTYPAEADFVVLADPDGNRFCVVDAGI